MKALFAVLLTLSMTPSVFAGYDKEERKDNDQEQQEPPTRKQQQQPPSQGRKQQQQPPTQQDPPTQQQPPQEQEPIQEQEPSQGQQQQAAQTYQVIARQGLRLEAESTRVEFDRVEPLRFYSRNPGRRDLAGGCDLNFRSAPYERQIGAGTRYEIAVVRSLEPQPRRLEDVQEGFERHFGYRPRARNLNEAIQEFRARTGITMSANGPARFVVSIQSLNSGGRLTMECDLIARDMYGVETSDGLTDRDLIYALSTSQGFLFEINRSF